MHRRRSSGGQGTLSLLACWVAIATLQVPRAAWAEGSAQPRSQSAEAEGETGNPTEIAKQNYRLGVQAFSEGRFQDAITAFLVADRLAPSAALSFNIARANDELHKPEESIYWYGDYLRRSPESPDRNEVQSLITEREHALQSRGVQLLVVLSQPSGATVYVDDAPIGQTPWHGTLSAGKYRLRVELTGYTSVASETFLHADKSLVVPFELESAPVEPAQAPAVAAPESVAPVAPKPASPPPPESSMGVWPWVALGAGAASFAVAGGFELARRSAEDEAKSGQVQLEVQDALDRMDSHQTMARVMVSAGVVFSALGGTLLFLDRDSESESVVSEITPAIGTDGFGLQVFQRF
jgi:hypothetical protein